MSTSMHVPAPWRAPCTDLKLVRVVHHVGRLGPQSLEMPVTQPVMPAARPSPLQYWLFEQNRFNYSYGGVFINGCARCICAQPWPGLCSDLPWPPRESTASHWHCCEGWKGTCSHDLHGRRADPAPALPCPALPSTLTSQPRGQRSPAALCAGITCLPCCCHPACSNTEITIRDNHFERTNYVMTQARCCCCTSACCALLLLLGPPMV